MDMDEASTIAPQSIKPEAALLLSRNQEIAQKKQQEMSVSSSNNAAVLEPSASVFRIRGRRRTNVREISNEGCDGGGDEVMTEKAEVEKKIAALQKIVPGGERLAGEKLFEETAEYILTLEWRVKALRFLGAFVEGSQKEKRKLGG